MKQFILMADVIASRNLSQNSLITNFKSLVDQANKRFEKNILSPLTITLGDEFQGVINNIQTSLEIILFLEESLLNIKEHFKLRYVLNEGEIETPVNKTIAYGMLGPGLTEARSKLNEVKGSKNRFNISIDNKKKCQILSESFIIFDNLVERWNPEKDYELVSNFLKFDDYKIISELMKKDRSQIWKREKSLNIASYKAIRNIIHITSQ